MRPAEKATSAAGDTAATPEADPRAVDSCRVCGGGLTREFFRMDAAPVFCNVSLPTRQAALDAPRGDIHLRACRECGYVYNAAFDPRRVEYSTGYENALHFSPRFRGYADALARRLVADLDLHN